MSQDEDQPSREEPTRRTPAPGSPYVGTLGSGAPAEESHGPMSAPRQDLLQQIKEFEGMLRFMGSAHPQKERVARRHRQLTLLLARWEEAQKMQQEMRTMMDRHK